VAWGKNTTESKNWSPKPREKTPRRLVVSPFGERPKKLTACQSLGKKHQVGEPPKYSKKHRSLREYSVFFISRFAVFSFN